MNMKTRFALILTACAMLLAIPGLRAQPNLQQILKDNAVGAHWIYHDFAKGVAEVAEKLFQRSKSIATACAIVGV